MAEIRKFEPGDGDGIQKLVRDALGENVRPVNPWDAEVHAEHVEPEVPGADELAASALPEHYQYMLGVVTKDGAPDEPW